MNCRLQILISKYSNNSVILKIECLFLYLLHTYSLCALFYKQNLIGDNQEDMQ